MHGLVIDQQILALSGLSGNEDVLSYIQVVQQVEFLVDDADALHLCVLGISGMKGLALIKDLTCIGLIDTRQDFHQRRFSCAIFTDQRMNFSFSYGEIYFIQGFDAGKCFRNLAHLQNGLTHEPYPPCSVLRIMELVWHTPECLCKGLFL